MKSRDMRVGMEVAVGIPNDKYGRRVRRGFIVDPEPKWRTYYEIGAGQRHSKSMDGRCVAVALDDGGSWRPATEMPSHILMGWADHQKKLGAEKEVRLKKSAELATQILELEKKHQRVQELLAKRGIEYTVPPKHARRYKNVTLDIDQMLRLLTQ